MPSETEARAIAKLIAQIDDLDAVRDQVGRRVIALFMVTFAAALTLLFYVALHDDPLIRPASPGGARVEAVLPGAPR